VIKRGQFGSKCFDESDGLIQRFVHLPVAGQYGFAHDVSLPEKSGNVLVALL
jgi:hypothetical protein